MFWPGINADMSDIVSQCSACVENQAYQKKELLIFHEISTDPWMKVGMDFSSFRSKSYLVIVDYYSNFIEVSLLNVIDHISQCFHVSESPK